MALVPAAMLAKGGAEVAVGVLGAGLVAALALGAIALIIVAIVIGARRERERTEALRTFAAGLGLRFTDRDPGLDQRMAAFPMFAVGHSRCGLNLMEGGIVSGGVRMSLLAGDYQYKVTTSNGKSTTTTTYNMSFVACMPVLSIGEELTVRGEGLFDKIGALIGFDDIDFESSEFSKRFHVRCSDRRFAFDLFDPRMMEYFLAGPAPRIHARGGVLLFDHGTRRWDPSGFSGALQWIDGFFGRIPRHVRAARLPAEDRATDPVLNPGADGTGMHGANGTADGTGMHRADGGADGTGMHDGGDPSRMGQA